jgi:threonine dehydrogenase-like Zn-dependent dehydrogenase
MGADLALDIATTTVEERRARVLAATAGRGPDVGIEASGSPRAVEEALSLVPDGGRYVIVGHYTNAGRIPFRAIGAKVYTLDQLNDALSDAEAMRLPKALVDPRRRAG